MKALRYLGTERLEVQNIEDAVPAPGEVLLRVKSCGICGSDVHGYLGLTGRRIPPMTMGHEFAAEVAAVTEGVTSVKPGDRVIPQPINFCGECENCRQGITNMCTNKKFFGVLTVDGAMAEYIAVPEKLLYKMPEHISYEIGALAEPYAVAYGAVKKAASELKGQTVLIIGAGTIGLCILQLVKLHDPKKVIVSDLSDKRLEAAKDFGADICINPSKTDFMEGIAKETGGRMVDISIEAVGVQATANQSIKTLKIGGTALWVGMSQKEMEINMQDIVCSARKIIGSFNYTHKEFGEVVEIIGSGRIKAEKLISKVVSLEEVQDTMNELHNNPDDYIKILVDPARA